MLPRYFETKDGLRLWVNLPKECSGCPNVFSELARIRKGLFADKNYMRGIVTIECNDLPNERKMCVSGVVDGEMFSCQNVLDSVSSRKCCGIEPKKAART